MAMNLHNISPAAGSKRSRKRVARGLASRGAYSGRGAKGQKSRAGVSGLKKLGMRWLVLSTPKRRGFNRQSPEVHVVKLSEIVKRLGNRTLVTPKTLEEAGLISARAKHVKILGDGEVKMAMQVKGVAVSASVKEKIVSAGGSVE